MARKRKAVTEIARQAKWMADTLLPRTTAITAAQVEAFPFTAPIAERYGISPATLAAGATFYHRVKIETGADLDDSGDSE